jgi:hypothetical protein
MNARIAYGHWFFIFNAVSDLPETLISGREDIWLRFIFHRWCYNPEALDDEALGVYTSAYRQPGAVRGSMEDVRKGVRSDGNICISVRALGTLPDLKTPGIVSAVYRGEMAEILAKSDISEQIASELYASHVQVRELRVVETSLEDVFLQTVYGGV